MQVTANEVVESLVLGDHQNLGRLPLRGAYGLAVLARGVFRKSDTYRLPEAEVIHVVASAVAHGSRLTTAVAVALDGLNIVQVSDARLASVPVTDFPGVGARSIGRHSTRGRLRAALRLRRTANREAVLALSRSRIYGEYLFLAQAIRYALVAEALTSSSGVGMVLSDFDRHAYTRPWVWTANELGLNTATMVHGSPNSNYIPVIAKTVLVWGEVQAEWFAKHSPGTLVEIVGRPDIPDPEQPKPQREYGRFITMDDIHRMVAD